MVANNSLGKDAFEVIIKTVEYGSWAKYAAFSDSPEYRETHQEMREHLNKVAQLPVPFQKYLRGYISQIIQTLHMSVRDYEAALKEIMVNDPEGRKIIIGALETMASIFQDPGFGILPSDFGIDLNEGNQKS